MSEKQERGRALSETELYEFKKALDKYGTSEASLRALRKFIEDVLVGSTSAAQINRNARLADAMVRYWKKGDPRYEAVVSALSFFRARIDPDPKDPNKTPGQIPRPFNKLRP